MQGSGLVVEGRASRESWWSLCVDLMKDI
jgi:hypothetical protein